MNIMNNKNTIQKQVEDNYIQQFLAVLKTRDNAFLSQNKEVPMGNGETVTAKSIMPMAKQALTIAEQRSAEKEKETVVCSAVMSKDGFIYRGHRHGHAMHALRDEGKELYNGIEQQGFITTKNRYVSREEGRTLQDKAGIPSADKDGYRHKTLFSEDLYQSNVDVIITPSTN